MAEQGYELLSPKNDVVFKMLFGNNEDLLKDLISSLIDIPIEELSDLHYLNTELPPDYAENKFIRLDLAIDVGNRQMNIEVQVRNVPDFKDRTLYYWAKLYTSKLKSGVDYSDLKKTISINILNFDMFDNKEYHNEVLTTVKQTGELFSDKLSMHFFELPKIAKQAESPTKRELWLKFIRATKKEEFDMLQKQGVPALQQAVNQIYTMSADEKVRDFARIREKALHDEASLLKGAREEGEAIGMQKGEIKGRAEGEKIGLSKGRAEGEKIGLSKGRTEGRTEMQEEIVRKMKSCGMSADEIEHILKSE